MRRKLTSRWIAIILTISLLLHVMPVGFIVSAEEGNTVEFFVSPSGNDDNVGTLEAPFASLERAKEAVRDADISSGVTVYVREGTYVISDTLKFTSEDSGTDNCPVVWQAYPGESVVLTGKATISTADFEVASAENSEGLFDKLQPAVQGNIYVYDLSALIGNTATLPEVPTYWETKDDAIESLFFNGEKAVLARYPNSGYLAGLVVENPQIYASPTSTVLAPSTIKGNNPEPGVISYSDDRLDNWSNESNPLLKGYFRTVYYEEPAKPIFDTTENTMMTEKVLYFGIADSTVEGTYTGVLNIYGYNLLCELDSDNEYYIDRDTKKLFIYDTNNDLSDRVIQYSVSNGNLIEIDGASNITIDGFRLEGAMENGISIISDNGESNKITIQNCLVQDCGTNGIIVDGGTNCSISDCTVRRTGLTGISVNSGDTLTFAEGNSVIENCDISYVGVTQTSTQAIYLAGYGNTVRGCYIHDTPHAAIDFGGSENTIEFNEIFNVCQKTADSGTIYSGGSWLLRGNTIRYNYIHDCETASAAEHINGIYLDDSGSDFDCYGNVIINVSGYGFHVANGRDHNIYDNIIIGTDNGWVMSDRNPRVVDGIDTNVAAERWNNASETYKAQLAEKYPELQGVYLESDTEADTFLNTNNLYMPAGTVIESNILVNTPFGSCTDRFSQFAERLELSSDMVEGENIFTVKEDDISAPLATYRAVLANVESSNADTLYAAKVTFIEKLSTIEWTDDSLNQISTASELKTALTTGGNYYLTNDITVTGTAWNENFVAHAAGADVDVILDLNGFSINLPTYYGTFINCQSSNVSFTLKDSSALKTGRISGLRLAFVNAGAGVFNFEGGHIAMATGDILRGASNSVAEFNIYEGIFSSQGTYSNSGKDLAYSSLDTDTIHIWGDAPEGFGADSELLEPITVSRKFTNISTESDLIAAFMNTMSSNGNQDSYIRLTSNITLTTDIQLKGDGTGSVYLDLNGHAINVANSNNRLVATESYSGIITIADHSLNQEGSIVAKTCIISAYKANPHIQFVGGTYSAPEILILNTPVSGVSTNVEVWEGTFFYTTNFYRTVAYADELEWSNLKHVTDVAGGKIVATECVLTTNEGTGTTITLDGFLSTEGRPLVGKSLTVCVSAKDGYTAEGYTLKVNGSEVDLTDGAYTIAVVPKSIVLESSAINSTAVEGYVVTTEVISGVGTVTSDKELVEQGGSVLITIMPANGYVVDSIKVNGESVIPTENTYSIENVQENVNVQVSFTKMSTLRAITNADELLSAMQNGGNYYLANDVAIIDTAWVQDYVAYSAGTNLNIILDLNGYKLTFPKNASGVGLRGTFINCQSDGVIFTLRDSSALKTGCIENLRISFVNATAGTFNFEGGSVLMYAGDILRGTNTSQATFNIYEGKFRSGAGNKVVDQGSAMAYSALQTAFASGSAQFNILGTASVDSFGYTTDLQNTTVSITRNFSEVNSSDAVTTAFLNTLTSNGSKNSVIKLSSDVVLDEMISLHGAGTGSVILDLNGHTLYLDSASADGYMLNIQKGYAGSITIVDYSTVQTGSIKPYGDQNIRSLFSINGADGGATPSITFIGGTYSTSEYGMTFNRAEGTTISVWDGVFNWSGEKIYAGSTETSANGVDFFYYNNRSDISNEIRQSTVVGKTVSVTKTAGENTEITVGTLTDAGVIADTVFIGKPAKIVVTGADGYSVNEVVLSVNGNDVVYANGEYIVDLVTGSISVSTTAAERISGISITPENMAGSDATITAPNGGWVEGTNTFTVSCADACVVAVSNDNGATYTRLAATATETDGTYNFTAENVTANTKIAVIKVGDVNGDGSVTNADATTAKMIFAGAASDASVLEMLAADANNDGKVTNADATVIKYAYADASDLKW